MTMPEQVQDRPTVGLVDDDAKWLAFTAAQLRRDGWQTVEYAAGEAMLTDFQGQFDVAVVDQRMQGLTGLQTVAELRSRGFGGPVVLMSAWLEPETLAEAARLGVMAASKVDQVSFLRVMEVLFGQTLRSRQPASAQPS